MLAWEWWGLAALVLGIAELLTGTFHLLVLAAACLGGALAAWAEAAAVVQMLFTAALAIAGWVALYRWYPARRHVLDATADRDVVLDIGERVTVDEWSADGIAQVSYRGAIWQAEREPGAPAILGFWRIHAVSGNRLVLQPEPSAQQAGVLSSTSHPEVRP
jgi:membrane protein implicated in regulation of membrane protease activity